MTGTIKRLMSDKGLGFISAPDGASYFFHHSSLVSGRIEDPREGQGVTLDRAERLNGPRGVNVCATDSAQ